MPTILNDDDKDTVKRHVPKATNKIQAVAVARLYVAYPDRSRWTYTGLQGAVVLANDLVGNTYWLKMVDISPSNRGVLWDQEIYDIWSYNQDRTYFHTFELEECLAGLSFVDEKEAKQFKKKMDDREKNASKATRHTPFGGANHQAHHKHGLLGGLFGSHRRSSPLIPDSPHPLPPPAAPPSSLPHSRVPSSGGIVNGRKPPSEFAILEAFDPNWRATFGRELSANGLTDDFIKENQEFIVDFLKDAQQKENNEYEHAPLPSHRAPPPAPPSPLASASALAPAPPPPPPAPGPPPASAPAHPPPASNGHGRAPPPPPPPPSSGGPTDMSHPISGPGSKRGAPPAPPPARRAGRTESAAPEKNVPPQSPPAPEPPRPRFAVPPPLPDAGKLAHEPPARSPRLHNTSTPNPGPPPPPRPPKIPEDDKPAGQRFGVPPPFAGARNPVPPPPPTRGSGPPPPPPRSSAAPSSAAPFIPPPPPLPPKGNSPAPPPLPPSTSRPVPPPPSAGSAPPPPAPPPALPLPPGHNAPPAPPLPPGHNAPPAPPPPPPAPVAADPSRSAVLQGIQKAGGIGALKKVDRSLIRDRSGAQVPGGGGDTGPHGSGLPPSGAAPGGGGGGMADALAAALQKRKEKVSRSDDERSDNDDW